MALLLCKTSTSLLDPRSPHYNTSDFERDEELCDRDSLSDIIDMHNELRAESEGEFGFKL